MIYLFYFVATIGAAYFLMAKRRPDAFLVAFTSSLVYFLPGFFGYVTAPYAPNHLVEVPLLDQVYAIYILVITAIVFFAIIADSSRVRFVSISQVHGERGWWSNAVVFIVILILTIVTGANYELSVFSSDKHEMMVDLPYLHKYLVLYAGFSAIFFVIRKQYFLAFLCFLIISWDVYIGFRGHAAFFLIGIFVVFLYKLGPIRLISLWRVHFAGLLAAIFMFSYKGVYVTVKHGEIFAAADKFFSIDGIRSSIMGSEPFITQAILNRVMRDNYRIPVENLADQFLAVIPLSRSLLSFNVPSFNDFFQEDLFPGFDYGMAQNWWAYWYSVTGWLGLLLGLMILLLGCVIVNRLLDSKSSLLISLSGMLAAIWLFYIHRNDVLYIFGQISHLVSMVTVTGVLVMVCQAIFSAGSRPILRTKSLDDSATYSEK